MLTNQQGQDGQLGSLLKGLQLFKPAADLVRLGATTLNPAFQVGNMFFRDPITYLLNTVKVGSIKDLPAFWGRAFAFAYNRLTGKVSGDAVMNLFAKYGGGQRMYSFEKGDVSGNLAKLSGASWWERFKNVGKGAVALLNAGETAPRALEFRNALEEAGISTAELDKRMIDNPHEDPASLADFINAKEASANVTTDFSRLGYHMRSWNRIVPFAGPRIAGLSNFIRNVQQKPGRYAAVFLGLLLGGSLLHWLRNRKKPWYEELEPHVRESHWIEETPWGSLIRIPRPQGPMNSAMALFEELLRVADQKNPQLAGWVAQTFWNTAPPIPFFGGSPAPLNTMEELWRNRAWTGRDIVPERDRDMPGLHNALNHQLPYAAQQLTGGIAGSPRLPFVTRGTPNLSVEQYYARLHELEAARSQATRGGRRFERRREYARLHSVQQDMQELGRQLNGRRVVNGRVVDGSPPSAERRRELEQRRIALARQALGR